MEPLQAHATPATSLFGPLLAKVSRSFYLSLRILPINVRETIALAYLLARIADTLCDTRAIKPAERSALLVDLENALEGNMPINRISQALSDHISDEEKQLLALLPQCITALQHFPQAQHIKNVLTTIIQGMKFDLDYFPDEESGRIRALWKAGELYRYTYLVAGCVGEFWSKICIEKLEYLKNLNLQQQITWGIQFGQALQLTNILRDIPNDARIGRCYLPLEDLHTIGLQPKDLLQAQNATTLRPVMIEWISQTMRLYDSALSYILHLPRKAIRLRLACLWPCLIGLATLKKIAQNSDYLDHSKPVKVKRLWVYFMLIWSGVFSCNNTLLHWIFKRYQRNLDKVL